MLTLATLFNAALIAFIMSTMLAAGMRTTIGDLLQVLRRGRLLVLVLTANLVVVPLLGLGVSETFGLAGAASVALILEAAMTGAAPLAAQVADGRAALAGDPGVLQVLAGLLVHFEVGFEILPGTGTGHPSPHLDEFAQEPLGDSAGG